MMIQAGTLEVGLFIADRPIYYLGTVLFGVAVVFVGMAIGGAPGDILPGS